MKKIHSPIIGPKKAITTSQSHSQHILNVQCRYELY